MNILVYGTGAIGSLMIHYLVKSGNDVTVVAGKSYDFIKRNGIVIYHYLQKKTTTDKVNVVQAPDFSVKYDAVFSVMQSWQQKSIAYVLSQINTELIVLVGNNTEADSIEKFILSQSSNEKRILFGFQNSAGHKENGKIVCGRLPVTELVIGGLHKKAEDKDIEFVSNMFSTSGYKITWLEDMYGYYMCHIAEIMPYAFLAYETGCDLKKASNNDIKRVMKATNEAFEYLKSVSVQVMPPKEDEFYGKGFKAKGMFLLYKIMSKTVLGELMLTDHCKNGIDEMKSIDNFMQEFRSNNPGKSMPVWDSMRKSLEKL